MSNLPATNSQISLQGNLRQFANLSDQDLELAKHLWTPKRISKTDFFNFQNSVCRHIGFITKGIFRIYYIDSKNELEQNVFFVPENYFLVSLKSFLTQTACPYYIEALEDSEIMVIKHEDLIALYPQSQGWERFGRLLAEQYFILTQSKTESLFSQTAEERYLGMLRDFPDLINRVSLGHLSSYLGIKPPSLSRIRAQLAKK